MNKGYIKISHELYVNQWKEIHPIIKEFRQTHIKKDSVNNIWLVYGVSKMFDELKEGDEVPEYRLILCWDKNKTMTYEFIRENILNILFKFKTKKESILNESNNN